MPFIPDSESQNVPRGTSGRFVPDQPPNLEQAIMGSLQGQTSRPGQASPVLGIPSVRSSFSRRGLPSSEELLAEQFAQQNPISSSVVDVARPTLNIVGGLASSNPLTGAILTPGAQSVSDIIEATLGNPQSPELQALSKRTFPEYATERGLEGALGATLAKAGEVIPSLISSGYRKLLRLGANPEVIEQAGKAADLGIDLPVGSSTGAPALAAAEKFLSRAPLTRGKVATIFEDVGRQLDDATETQLSSLSPNISDSGAGTKVGDTIKGVYKQGLESNNINFRAVPESFSNPTEAFSLPKQQARSLELLDEYTKASPSNQNSRVVKRLKEAAGIDGTITPEILSSLDDTSKMELIEKFLPKKAPINPLDKLPANARGIYEALPQGQKAEFLRQAGISTAPVGFSIEDANQLIGKPIDKIINQLTPESKSKLLETIVPRFDWDTLTLKERAGINEAIQDLRANGKNTDAFTLDKLAKSLREDMGDIAASQGRISQEAFKKADQEYQEFVRLFHDNPKIAKILTSTEPTAIREAVTGKGSVTFVKDLKNVVGDTSEAFNVVKRKYAEDFLGGSKVDTDTLKEVFTPDEFKAITDFKKTADFVKSKTPGKIPDNFSVGNPNVISLGVGGVGYLAGGVPGALGTAATTQVIAPMVLSRALLSPSGRALILEGARTPTKSAKGAQIATKLITLFGGEAAIESTKPEPIDINSGFPTSRK